MSYDNNKLPRSFNDFTLDLKPPMVRLVSDSAEEIWVNAEWLKFRGLPSHADQGHDWLFGVHPSDLAHLNELFQVSWDARQPFETRYRVLDSNGSYRWLLHRDAPQYNAVGKFIGFQAICIDINDAVASDLESAQFFDIASDIFLTTRLDGSFGRFNPSIERILGWNAGDLSNASYQQLIHPDDYVGSGDLRERLLTGEDVVNFENRFRHKDGSYRWLSWRCRHEATTQTTYACALDITERKHHEQALENALGRFNLAINATSEGVYEYDFDAESFYVSPRFKEQLGFTNDEAPIDVNDWIAMVHPEDVDATLDAHRRHLEGEVEDLNVTFRMQHRSGEWRKIRSRAVLMRHDDGRPCRIVGIHDDVTEQDRHERELQKLKEEAEAANRAKSDFLANMSHEIRTPMNVILGAASMLRRGMLSAEKQVKALDAMMESSNSLMSLINDLLDFSKIEARALNLDIREFDARALIAEVANALEMQASTKGLAIQQQNRCACVNERLFLGDRERIKQIIMNLVANAVKFTESGTITLSVDCVPTDQEDIEELRFYISDTGIGIPSDKLATIFGKFEQADSSITRRFGGTGLGLAIAKSLSEAMGGAISAQSEVGIGSTFVVRLPLQRTLQQPDTPPPSSARPEAHRAQVLLVEDNPGNVLVATHFLEEFGYAFEVTVDGLEAVELIRSGRKFDVILMDIQMPRMDGRQATRAIREFEIATQIGRTPIVAMTAHALMHDRNTCLQDGMDDYISKPIDIEQLRDILRSFVGPPIASWDSQFQT